MREILGPAGQAALINAQRAVLTAHPEARSLMLTWVGWTRADWEFTFVQRDPAHRYSVHVPHDGSPLAIRRLDASDRPGTGPLAD
ncbi:MAG TPA: hypothetical protein VNT51_09690 [Miltoncostaeaceae bacterium]|nr:hypothetical protein [Miltoncostaeaceae bacterium]